MRIPPGPPQIQGIVSTLRFFNETDGDFLAYAQRKMAVYGDFFQLDFGSERMYMVANPDAIYEILVTKNAQFYKGKKYRDRQRGLARFLGNGLLTSDGEFWKRQRKLIAPALHARRIEAYAETMVSVTSA